MERMLSYIKMNFIPFINNFKLVSYFNYLVLVHLRNELYHYGMNVILYKYDLHSVDIPLTIGIIYKITLIINITEWMLSYINRSFIPLIFHSQLESYIKYYHYGKNVILYKDELHSVYKQLQIGIIFKLFRITTFTEWIVSYLKSSTTSFSLNG